MLRIISGDNKNQQVLLDTEEMPIVFGALDPNQEAGQKKDFMHLCGPKIVNHHFEINYDKANGTIVLRNLNFNSEQSCGLYKMLFSSELHNLQPGDGFRIGTLEFMAERFNTAIISDIGQRDYMEDYHTYVQQLINLDNKV